MVNFVFGPLATQEARIKRQQMRRRGVHHLNWLDPLAPQAGERPTVKVTVGLEKNVDKVMCLLTDPESLSLPMKLAGVEWDELNWAYHQEWCVTLPPSPEGTVVRYTIEAHPDDGSAPIQADDGATFSYRVGDPNPPDWTAGAIIYQIFPDRFHPGSGHSWDRSRHLETIHGGTLRGIIEQLDYIADLGFNCLWLNPIFPDEKTYHGYHATDYFQVNPRLGTLADVHELVDQAHARGIRLLLDFVANHWGRDHPTFQATLADPDSEYHHWYHWNHWPDDYETFIQVKELPQINVDHPPAREHLLKAARFWLTEFDIDGYRLDYALGPSHDFWTDFGAAVRSAKPDAWIFGEVVDTPAEVLSYWGRMHGCLDFLLHEALRQTFAGGQMSLAAFDAFLNKHENFFPAGYSRPSFLDNHDMNRFLWTAGGDKRRLKLATLCQFTLSGQPIVYYGTEVGLSQQRDMVSPSGRHSMAEARQPMLWGDEQDGDLRNYYRWLIQLRRQHPVLWRGSRQTVHLDQTAVTYAYRRWDEHEAITVALNLSDQEQRFEAAGQVFTLPPFSGDFRAT